MNYRELLTTQPVLPAPMCGISDFAFRSMCRLMGATYTFTQMVSSEAMVRGDRKTLDILDLAPDEGHVAMQVFGGEPQALADSARRLEDLGASVIDLNMGCPARKVTGGMAGSALLRELPRVGQIFRAMRRAVTSVPLTAKMRWDWGDGRAALEVARMAEAEGLDGICLHARTREQGYSGAADWAMIGELKAAVGIPVIGNGDIRRPADALGMRRVSGCDAVMIGRALIGDPWLMAETLEAWRAGAADEARTGPTWELRRRVMLAHATIMLERRGPRGLVAFRKHAVGYLRGMPGARKLRERLMQVTMLDELEEVLATEPSREEFEAPAATGSDGDEIRSREAEA